MSDQQSQPIDSPPPSANEPSPFRKPLAEHVTCIRCRYDLIGLPRMGTCPECHLPIAASIPPEAVNDGTVLRDARPCITCGYNLIGLHLNGNCPECGTAVEKSLKGVLLRYASIDYLNSLRRGAQLSIWGMAATVAVVFSMVFWPVVSGYLLPGAGSQWLRLVPTVGFLACSIAVAYGHFALTTPDPGYTGIERPNSARQVARISSICVIAMECLALLLQFATTLHLAAIMQSPGPLGAGSFSSPLMALNFAASAGGYLAWAVRFFAMMSYVRWLATRIPDSTMIRQTRTYTWLLPLLTVLLACVVLIGPLIAMIMYCVMLSRLRWHVNRFISDRRLATV